MGQPPGRNLVASDTLSGNVVRALLAEATRRGLDEAELRRRFDIPDEVVRDVDSRVTAGLLVRIWTELPVMLSDDDFGLHLGESTSQTSIPLAGKLFESYPTLGEALEKMLSFQRLMNDVHPTRFERGPAHGTISVRSRGSAIPAPRHATEFVFAWMLLTSRRTTGVDFAPLRVRFEHGRPRSTREHARIFHCPVDFDADRAEVAVASSVLDLPQRTADPAMVEILESHAHILVGRLPDRTSFATRVKDAIVPLLARGASVEAVAGAMRLSERSVQRYLQQEGTSFAEALADVRRSLAEAALRDTATPIAAVSIALGFSDQSAFHKAFARWTGMTPGAFRRASGLR